VSTPFYVSPETLMKDRADYARKGISRGRSIAVLDYADGVLFVGENPSRALHKTSEIYDRIALAAVGRYNEFESLRLAGVRLADTRGYMYDRRDVSGRGLANAYAQTLGTIFSEFSSGKPYEVELVVAEVGDAPDGDQIYRLTYDGQVVDEHGFVVVGGAAEAVSSELERAYSDGMSLGDALRAAVAALGRDGSETRALKPAQLEVAVLDRTRPQQRKFQRVVGAQLAALLGNGNGDGANGVVPDGGPAVPDDGDVLDEIDSALDDDDESGPGAT
jgi:proteasome alpha subunit